MWKMALAFYFPSSGKVTIDNSVINAKHAGCASLFRKSYNSRRDCNYGDRVNLREKTDADGPIADGAAVSIVNRDGYKKLETVM